jgi:mannose-1-phosphate guanylyltransferase
LKAVILAGGKGQRAKPFSEITPKVMIPLFGRPVIDFIVRHLTSFEIIEEVIIINSNNDYLNRQILSYFEGKENLFGNKVKFIDEIYSGTGGSILSAKEELKDQRDFLVWFGDNLVPLDVDSFYKFHIENTCFGTLVVSSQKRAETGFVVLRSDKRIMEFKEKPLINLDEPESLGIYLFRSRILDHIDRIVKIKDGVNLSYDVLEKLIVREKIYGFSLGNLDWIDIESPTKVARNLDLISNIIRNLRLNLNYEEII